VAYWDVFVDGVLLSDADGGATEDMRRILRRTTP
jgi:hypothetical protein